MPVLSPLPEFLRAPADQRRRTCIGRTIPQARAMRAGACLQLGSSTQGAGLHAPRPICLPQPEHRMTGGTADAIVPTVQLW